MNDDLTPSAACLALIRRSEGFSAHAYMDGGTYACGYGTHHPDIRANTVWSQEEAEGRLIAAVSDVAASIRRLVLVPLTQGQFDALTDFAYNLGTPRLAGSTLLTDLNAGRYEDAGLQLLRWCYADGQQSDGLRARRIQELAMWAGKSVAEITSQVNLRQGVAA